jgi:hypothetical protein
LWTVPAHVKQENRKETEKTVTLKVETKADKLAEDLPKMNENIPQ